MAKTIHDLAVEYGKVNYIVRYTADGEKEIDEDTGADYVLGEILDKTSKCINIKDAYEVFLECVEQLKK